jgi:hypothetical protein
MTRLLTAMLGAEEQRNMNHVYAMTRNIAEKQPKPGNYSCFLGGTVSFAVKSGLAAAGTTYSIHSTLQWSLLTHALSSKTCSHSMHWGCVATCIGPWPQAHVQTLYLIHVGMPCGGASERDR